MNCKIQVKNNDSLKIIPLIIFFFKLNLTIPLLIPIDYIRRISFWTIEISNGHFYMMKPALYAENIQK